MARANNRGAIAVVLAAGLTAAGTACADPIADSARARVQHHPHAVVFVEAELDEVLADDWTKQVKQGLTAPRPSYLPAV